MLAKFSSEFIERVEEIYNDENKRKKILVLLSYFQMLYMTLHDEAKIAFGYQLMESLARHNKIKFGSSYKSKIVKELSKKVCFSCRTLIKQEIKTASDNFVGYIGKALGVIKKDKIFIAQPSAIKKVAEKYRHHVFHGSFFEDMTMVDKIVASLPQDYQNDLSELFQAIASVIGANFILGIDFNQMIAIKRNLQ